MIRTEAPASGESRRNNNPLDLQPPRRGLYPSLQMGFHEVMRANRMPIHRHVKVRVDATEFDPARRRHRKVRAKKRLAAMKRINSEVPREEGPDAPGSLSVPCGQEPRSAREITPVPGDLMRLGHPRLVVLEGPAGVGKTTLLGPLVEALRLRGVPARSLPEFSLSPLGESLQDAAALETDRAAQWCRGLAGLLAFVSDRVAKLETALANPGMVHVCDRFFSSEALLVQATIKHELDQKTGSAILFSLFEWAAARFSGDSVVLMLSTRTADKRIRQRLGGRLGEHAFARLRHERQAYARLVDAGVPWAIRRVSTDREPERVAQMLAEWICGKWRL